MAEGYRRLERVEAAMQPEQFLRPRDRTERTEATAKDVRETVGVMDETDAGERARLIAHPHDRGRAAEGSGVYTKGRLHAKAYIFDWTHPTATNAGVAIVAPAT